MRYTAATASFLAVTASFANARPLAARDSPSDTFTTTVVSTETLALSGQQECTFWRLNVSKDGIVAPGCGQWVEDVDNSTTKNEVLELRTVKLVDPNENCTVWHVAVHAGYVEPVCGEIEDEAHWGVKNHDVDNSTQPFISQVATRILLDGLKHKMNHEKDAKYPKVSPHDINESRKPTELEAREYCPPGGPGWPACCHGRHCPPETYSQPKEINAHVVERRHEKPVYDPSANVGPVELPSVAPVDHTIDGTDIGRHKEKPNKPVYDPSANVGPVGIPSVAPIDQVLHEVIATAASTEAVKYAAAELAKYASPKAAYHSLPVARGLGKEVDKIGTDLLDSLNDVKEAAILALGGAETKDASELAAALEKLEDAIGLKYSHGHKCKDCSESPAARSLDIEVDTIGADLLDSLKDVKEAAILALGDAETKDASRLAAALEKLKEAIGKKNSHAHKCKDCSE